MTQKKTRILFLSCSAGSGHVRAAEALCNTAQTAYADRIEAEHINIITFLPKTVSFSMLTLYPWLVNRGKELWRFLYETADNPKLMGLFYKTAGPIMYARSSSLLKHIEAYAPDIIVCTHSLAGQLLSLHRAHGHPIPPFFIVLTDYEIHSYWMIRDTAGYFVPSEQAIVGLHQFFSTQKPEIYLSGIPVLPLFSQKYDLKQLRENNGIMHKQVLLLLSGGEGMVRLDAMVRQLCTAITEKTTIIAIAGKNDALRKKIESVKTPSHIQLIVYGWTDRIHELMAVADVIFTKPGGMTVSEAMESQKKMLLISPIPGQEEGNIRYLRTIHYPHVVHKKNESLTKELLTVLSLPNPTQHLSEPASRRILNILLQNQDEKMSN